MIQPESYIRWPSVAKIPLFLSIADISGNGVIGASPEVSIRRYRETYGSSLDGWYWTGTSFTATPTWIPMTAVDAVNSPGLYTYLFDQDVIGLEHVYLVYMRSTTSPFGLHSEFHMVTNELYVPATVTDPVTVSPQTVMGQLEIVKGLLHHNGMLDKQTYTGGQLTSARLRIFDTPAHVPAVEGGSETIGLLAEFSIESAYDTFSLNKKFVLKRVYP